MKVSDWQFQVHRGESSSVGEENGGRVTDFSCTLFPWMYLFFQQEVTHTQRS